MLKQLYTKLYYILLLKVRDFLMKKSNFNSRSDWVTVLDGNQEGAYQWVC